jgi:hypothetical protein
VLSARFLDGTCSVLFCVQIAVARLAMRCPWLVQCCTITAVGRLRKSAISLMHLFHLLWRELIEGRDLLVPNEHLPGRITHVLTNALCVVTFPITRRRKNRRRRRRRKRREGWSLSHPPHHTLVCPPSSLRVAVRAKHLTLVRCWINKQQSSSGYTRWPTTTQDSNLMPASTHKTPQVRGLGSRGAHYRHFQWRARPRG